MSTESPVPEAEYDGPWKDALELGFPLFLAYFLPELHAAIDWSREHEFLHQELQALTPASATGLQGVDLLVKALTPAGDARYLHAEAQMTRDGGFAGRVEDYRCALRLHYRQPIISIGILGDADPSRELATYEAWQGGCQASAYFL